MKLAAGRGFTIHDNDASARVAVVNETFARTFFVGQNPLGRRISTQRPFRPSDAIEVVGVVRDSKQNDLRRDTRSVLYMALHQSRSDVNSIEVRTHGNPLVLAQPVRELVTRAHRDIELRETKTLEEHVDRSLVRERLLSELSGFFGAVALALAAIGLYGILAYAVERRRQEMGIRMALGATAREVERMLLGEALRLAAIGLLAGLPLAYGAGRLVESFLYGLTPGDPWTLAGASALLIAIALAAAYVPARRASRIDPMTALRQE
jgi:predicted permease